MTGAGERPGVCLRSRNRRLLGSGAGPARNRLLRFGFRNRDARLFRLWGRFGNRDKRLLRRGHRFRLRLLRLHRRRRTAYLSARRRTGKTAAVCAIAHRSSDSAAAAPVRVRAQAEPVRPSAHRRTGKTAAVCAIAHRSSDNAAGAQAEPAAASRPAGTAAWCA